MRLAEHVATMWGGEWHAEFWWEKPEGRNHLEELEVDGKMVLKRIFKTLDGNAWIGLIQIRIGTVGGLL